MAPSTVQRNKASEVDWVQMELKYEPLMFDFRKQLLSFEGKLAIMF